MARSRVLVVIGTRPEAIKLAPVVHELRRREDRLETSVCLTGQHRDLIDPLVQYFELRPDADLQLMQPDQTPASLTSVALAALDRVIADRRPDWLVIQGDTATVLAASLAGFLNRVRVMHVEAGLRSGTLDQPWPEEFNRRVASLASTHHAAPTQHAADALLREGVEPCRVRVTGNPVIDALHWTLRREQAEGAGRQEKYHGLTDEPLVLITAHRRENLGPRMSQIAGAIKKLADNNPRHQFLWPLHPNPAIRRSVVAEIDSCANVHLTQPAEYAEFAWLMNRAVLVISDSGGIQEEAPALGKPVLVLRDVTERPEALETGLVELVGVEPSRIVAAANAWLRNERLPPANIIQPFGDGHAAQLIVDWLASE